MFSCECSQNFVASDRQILHASADRVEDCIGNGCNCRNLAGLPDAFCAIRSVPVVAFDKDHLDLRRIAMREKPRAVESRRQGDRKSTRLNSSHGYISYAVFCLKKKNQSAPF